jgi:hypothetical protein
MSERVKLDYYALGKYDNKTDLYKMGHQGFIDKSSNIVERNAIYLNNSGINVKDNIKNYSVLNDVDKNCNNYLQPTKVFNLRDKHNPSSNLANLEIFKQKSFAK